MMPRTPRGIIQVLIYGLEVELSSVDDPDEEEKIMEAIAELRQQYDAMEDKDA